MTVREAFYDLTKRLFADEFCPAVDYKDKDLDPVKFYRYHPYYMAKLRLNARPFKYSDLCSVDEWITPSEPKFLKFLQKVRNIKKYDLNKEVDSYFCRPARKLDPDCTHGFPDPQFVCVYGNKYLVWDILERILIEYNI